VVELVHLVGVGERAAGPVEHQRVVLPRVPQPRGHVEELVGAVVAGVVIEVLTQSVVLRPRCR